MSTKQAIAGVCPPEEGEVVSMTVWPTMAAFRVGRWVGSLSANPVGSGFFTLGKLFALATIPVTLVLFVWGLLPFVCRRYALTNRRMVIQKGLAAVDERSIDLDQFDSIDVEVLPGQQFFHAGDLVFRSEGEEVLRLAGVGRAEVFREVCLAGRTAFVSVGEVLRKQAVS